MVHAEEDIGAAIRLQFRDSLPLEHLPLAH
jgi:hypothetical protein